MPPPLVAAEFPTMRVAVRLVCWPVTARAPPVRPARLPDRVSRTRFSAVAVSIAPPFPVARLAVNVLPAIVVAGPEL